MSEAGKRRTIETFGAPLTPQEVVEKICNDAAEKDFRAPRLFGANRPCRALRRRAARPSGRLDKALDEVEPEFLESVDRVRDNVATFQEAILLKSVRVERENGWLGQRYLPLRRVGVCVLVAPSAYPPRS